MRLLFLCAFVPLLLGAATPPPPLGGEEDPVLVRAEQPPLDEAAARFAALWARGDAGGIAGLLSGDGVRLQLGQGGYASVGTRQATAAIRDFHNDQRTSRARVLRVSEVPGTPRRGFAELDCGSGEGGGRDASGYAVFVGFIEESGGWRVSEIRVLR